MLVEDFMESFADQFQTIEDKIAVATDELNSVTFPDGIGPLRLSKNEIINIVETVGDSILAPEALGAVDIEYLDEGMDELADQLYLHQFPQTMPEAMSAFHRDLVTIIRLNPVMFGPLTAIIQHLKIPAPTPMTVSRKFETLLIMTQECLDALTDDIPDYVSRMLDEIADFSDCMTIATPPERKPLFAANDNCGQTTNTP